MNKQPAVSVIVPNYNHARYLKERINSILDQTFQDFELILLDDCSTDNSAELLNNCRNNPHVSHIELNEQNSGSAFRQWEKGIQLAQGKYIWIAESDDKAENRFLERAVEALEKHPEAQLCLTGSHLIDTCGNPLQSSEFDQWDEDGRIYEYSSLQYLRKKLLNQNTVYNASMVLFRRKNCLKDITPAYKKMRYCGDWLFWIEQARKGNVVEIHQKLNFFRKHPDNTTNQGTREGNSIPEMISIRKYFYQHVLPPQCCTDIVIDKALLYGHIKHLPISAERRKELLLSLKKELNINWLDYLIGKWIRSLLKHKKSADAQIL